MPTNVHPEYVEAEKHFYEAQTDKERLEALKEMISTMPKHKSAETLRKNIRTRYKKLKQKVEKEKIKSKSRGKSTSQGIKKLEMQAILLGFTNTGKSSILKSLTNANPKIANYGFTTKELEQGILNYGGCQIQIVDLPPVGSETFDSSIINTADTILLVINSLSEIPELENILKRSKAKQIVVFNKIDLYDGVTKRKLEETLKSKKYNFAIISCITGQGLDELKEKILNSFPIIRVYTKQPNQKQTDDKPMILPPNSTIFEAAEKAIHGKAKEVVKARIWGPSSKFGGQQVGLKHVLKDKDIVEFQTK